MVCNEILDVRVYHCSCMRAYMTFRMASCVAIHWPLNRQRVKCVPNVSNSCLYSHLRKLNVEGWIKSRRKWNVEVKVKCVMWNKLIDDLTTNHSLALLLEQEQMQVLDAKEMESSSKIDIRDVSWWMPIKDACRHWVPISARLFKEGCISLIIGGRPFRFACKHD